MFPSLDIFKIDSGGVLWRGAVETVEAAKSRIQTLALSSPVNTSSSIKRRATAFVSRR